MPSAEILGAALVRVDPEVVIWVRVGPVASQRKISLLASPFDPVRFLFDWKATRWPSAEIEGTFTPPEPLVVVTCVNAAAATSYTKISLLPSGLVPT